MSNTAASVPGSPASSLSSPSSSSARTSSSSGSPAHLNEDTSHGKTIINDAVVSKIAGIAAREVPGVHDLGGGASRAIGALRTRLNGQDHSQGVSVEVGETQVAADVTLVADYPMSLQGVADGVRDAITSAIESLVGLEVTEVNVTVADVYIPSEDDDTSDDSSPRVQ